MIWERALILAAVLLVAWLGYVWWHRRQGVVRAVAAGTATLSSQRLGVKRGFAATFVQFSTQMCAKCPPTARMLRKVADEHRGVKHVEVDAEVRLDLAREFGVMRTPTVLVLDDTGTVVARMAGAPTEHQVREALAAAMPTATDYSI